MQNSIAEAPARPVAKLLKVRDVKCGTRRRKQMGDLESLAASIADLNLLHPIVVDEDSNLVVGERRLQAVKLLDWDEVPVVVAKNLGDVHTALRAERDENSERLPFTPSEAAAMARALEPFEKKAAAEREAAGRKRGDESSRTENFSVREKGRAADKVAEAVGMSRPTLAKAQAVVEAAEKHPDHYGDLPARMDATGKVSPAYAELVERQKNGKAPKTHTPISVTSDLADERHVDPADDDEYRSEGDEDLPPVPAGPTPAEIVKNDPVTILSKMLQDLWSGVNSFFYRDTLKNLKAAAPDRRKRLATSLEHLRDEIDKLRKELE